jgi:uncharacterized protein
MRDILRPGRPRCPRRIEREPAISFFKPQGVPPEELEVVLLSLEEFEAVRLSDLEGLDQEEAAQRMGISRRALWEDLQNARKKIVEALVTGKAIEIKGGNYTVERLRRYTCYGCHTESEIPSRAGEPMLCPHCRSNDIHEHPAGLGHNGRNDCCHKGCCKKGKETRSDNAGTDERVAHENDTAP